MAVIFPTDTATTFGTLDIGDALLGSTNLLACVYELCSKITKATANFNRQNEARPVPAPSLSVDEDAKQLSFSGEFGYQVIKNLAGENVDRLDNFLDGYVPWTTPTTGYFKDVVSMPDALDKICNYMTYVADQLEPGGVYTSPSGFITYSKDAVAKKVTISVNTGVNIFINATGETVVRADNWAKVIDDQQGFV